MNIKIGWNYISKHNLVSFLLKHPVVEHKLTYFIYNSLYHFIILKLPRGKNTTSAVPSILSFETNPTRGSLLSILL